MPSLRSERLEAASTRACSARPASVRRRASGPSPLLHPRKGSSDALTARIHATRKPPPLAPGRKDDREHALASGCRGALRCGAGIVGGGRSGEPVCSRRRARLSSAKRSTVAATTVSWAGMAGPRRPHVDGRVEHGDPDGHGVPGARVRGWRASPEGVSSLRRPTAVGPTAGCRGRPGSGRRPGGRPAGRCTVRSARRRCRRWSAGSATPRRRAPARRRSRRRPGRSLRSCGCEA
jgi:hypothetical protein